jgi:hypothetical protein
VGYTVAITERGEGQIVSVKSQIPYICREIGRIRTNEARRLSIDLEEEQLQGEQELKRRTEKQAAD